MLYKRKIYKSGNSEVVSIPPTLLKELGIRAGDEVVISKAKKGINIEPALKEGVTTKVTSILDLAGIIDPGENFDIEKLFKEMEEEYGR